MPTRPSSSSGRLRARRLEAAGAGSRPGPAAGERVTLSWIRRTRRDGDAWEPVEVPLGEDGERYEVDILREGTPVRMMPSATPEVLYPTAQELADFGAPQSALTLRIAQVSASVGRGFETITVVPVT